MRGLVLMLMLCGGAATADTVVATRTIRAQSIIGPEDLTLSAAAVPGAVQAVAEVIGSEARVTLYAGRPIRPSDIAPPAIVTRNQIVGLVFQSGTLAILTDGRALDRAAVGEPVRVMNLASRTTVTGLVRADGSVLVGNHR